MIFPLCINNSRPPVFCYLEPKLSLTESCHVMTHQCELFHLLLNKASLIFYYTVIKGKPDNFLRLLISKNLLGLVTNFLNCSGLRLFIQCGSGNGS